MRVVEIVRVDTRGRITMPTSLRETLGIAEGMHVMLIGDLEKHEIRILPFADPEATLVEFQITLTDEPGSLAKIAAILAENRVDLLTSQSRTLRKGRNAEWFVIADVSKCSIDMKMLEQKIVASKSAERVLMKKFE
ncbi:MAG: AbrB family transcriptional regulator [Candidatus Heimdallarchaeota archaeon]|nr:AbrB family transcriptional regulator [Candidatus Heimdallarchaeota archaeon]